MVYRPVRERKPEVLMDLSRKLVDNTGYNEISLVSLSSADYSCLAPLVKHGGLIALALPGLKKELTDGLPPEMALSWTEEDIETIHSAGWWAELLSKSREVELLSVREMDSFDECWADWLACDNPYAVGDRRAMEAGAGKYMNFISAVCRRK